MAKKSTKSVKNSDPKILRNYDIYSMEKRVYDMDGATQRSYDIFSLEKRIYDLEQGEGPTPPTPTPTATEKFIRNYNDPWTGTYTAPKAMTMQFMSNGNNTSTFNLAVNGVDISETLTTNATSSRSSVLITTFTVNKDDVVSWSLSTNERCFVAFDLGE